MEEKRERTDDRTRMVTQVHGRQGLGGSWVREAAIGMSRFQEV